MSFLTVRGSPELALTANGAAPKLTLPNAPKVIVCEAGLTTKLCVTEDAAKFPVKVALWMLYGEEGHERWRLILASPLYDKLGHREAFFKMFHAVSGSSHNWATSPITLESTRHPLIRDLRKRFGKSGRVRVHLGGQMIGGRWVHDLYIYRIR
jgi:hypothetical protein